MRGVRNRRVLTRELIPVVVAALIRCRSIAAAARHLGLKPKQVFDWLACGQHAHTGLSRELYEQAVAAGWKPPKRKPNNQGAVGRPPESWEAERCEALLRALVTARRVAPGASAQEIVERVLGAVNRGQLDLAEFAGR